MSTGTTNKPHPSISVKNLSPAAVRRIGVSIGKNLVPGSTVALRGQLGVGKTFLIQAICEGLEVTDPVTSPTFTIINNYAGRYPVYHVDLYRLREKRELLDIGIEELVEGKGICLVEWAERAEGLLGEPRLDVEIEWADLEERNITFSFVGNGVWDETRKKILERMEK